MMILLLVIGIALTGLASAILGRVLLWPSGGSGSMGVPKRVEAYGFEKGEQATERRRPAADEVATKLGSVVGDRSTIARMSDSEGSPLPAGLYRVTRAVHGLPHLCTAGVSLMFVWLAASAGFNPAVCIGR
jgi:hypothetical protein